MHERLGITTMFDTVLDRRKAFVSLVFAATPDDRNAAEFVLYLTVVA